MLDQAAEGLENPELAEDVLADLFFALYVHDNSIDPLQLAATWLKEQGSWPRRYLNLQDYLIRLSELDPSRVEATGM